MDDWMTKTSAFLDRLWAIFLGVPWFTLGIITLSVVVMAGLIRFHRKDDNRYDLWDLLMERGKADLNKHIIVGFAVLSIWVIVWLVQKNKEVETLLLGCLGIFVANRAITSVTNTIKGTPPDPPMQDKVPPPPRVDVIIPEEPPVPPRP